MNARQNRPAPIARSFIEHFDCKPVSRHGLFGFSLLELLIVVTIIAILAAMLLPALGRAKQRSSGIVCQNNQRQLWLAWKMYADDNQDVLPYFGVAASIWYEPRCVESSPLWPYTANNRGVFQCPSWRYFGQRGYVGMSLNWPIGGDIYDPELMKPPIEFYHKAHAVLWPSRLFVFTDARQDYLPQGEFIWNWLNWNDPLRYRWITWPSVAHYRAGTFTFVDGHSEIHRWRDPRTLPVPIVAIGDGSDPSDQPNNPDIAWVQEHGVVKAVH